MWYEKIERLNEYFKEINHARIKPVTDLIFTMNV